MNPNLDQFKHLPPPPGTGKGYTYEELLQQGITPPPQPKQPSLLKKIGSAIIGSETKAGGDIASAIVAPQAQQITSQNQQQHAQDIQTLSGLAKNLQTQGKDTTHVNNLLQQLLSETQNNAVPGGEIGQITPEVNKTTGQVLGDFGGVALDVLAPGVAGKSTKGLTGAAKIAGAAKNVGKGAALGYGLDVAQNFQQGNEKPFTPGMGTAIGGAIPLVGEAIKPISNAVSELSGSLTGQNRGGQKALSESIQAGGESAKLARGSMRGKITSQQVQQEARDALQGISSKKTQDYQNALSALKENKNSYDISPVVNKMKSQLDEFGIKEAQGALDFSQSPLRFNTEAKKDIQTIYDEMKGFGSKPGDRTVVGLDALKRAFSDLYSPSGEARKFVTGMSSEVRNILKQVPGYDKMAEDYAQKTGLIKDIQQNLSLGTRAGADTAYKKLSQVLRSDTDARKQLLQELDKASGGKLKPMLAGSLANPILPRGLTRFGAGLAGAGAAETTGGNLLAAFKAALVGGAVTSPRLAGEIINILGITGSKTKTLRNALTKMFDKYTVTKVLKGNQE
jgi:hypothetical protein